MRGTTLDRSVLHSTAGFEEDQSTWDERALGTGAALDVSLGGDALGAALLGLLTLLPWALVHWFVYFHGSRAFLLDAR